MLPLTPRTFIRASVTAVTNLYTAGRPASDYTGGTGRAAACAALQSEGPPCRGSRDVSLPRLQRTRPDRPHPARPPPAVRRRPVRIVRQAGEPESRRVDQGPHRPVDDRGGRAGG